MPGVIERVIENWLTSSNERSYQIPFCQLLAAEGETVIYLSSHGPFEQGKDVVTFDKSGKLRGYQLKSGDFGLSEWRKYKGEINDLVELPIAHPAAPSSGKHTPFLVTNGEINDPAIRAINSANAAWRQRRYPALRTISKGQLLKRFLAAHGAYLPKELSDFNLFMELVLADGRHPLDKEKVCRLLESVLPLANGRKLKPTEARRSLSSAVLLVGYVLQGAYALQNHWAVFEGWTLAASYVLAVASKNDLAEEIWSISFDLCEHGAVEALSQLALECGNREHLVEGDALTDGHFYHARVTLLVGLISAWSLYHRIKRDETAHEQFVREFLRKWLSKMKIWGESAVPYFVAGALETEASGDQISGESLLINVLTVVLNTNGQRTGGPGMTSPYYSPEQALRLIYKLDPECREDFLGSAYTVYPLIDFLARHLRRQALRSLWYPITGNSLKTFYPEEEWEWFRWRAETGVLRSQFLNSPQSWSKLVSEAENVDTSFLPRLLRLKPAFAIFFVLVYPHRFTREVLKLIEDSLRPERSAYESAQKTGVIGNAKGAPKNLSTNRRYFEGFGRSAKDRSAKEKTK